MLIPQNMSTIRLLGVTIPHTDKVMHGLSRIYGIGLKNAQSVCAQLTIPPKLKVGQLKDQEIKQLSDCLSKMTLEGDLERDIQSRIIKQVQLNAIKGFKFQYGLPTNGGRRRSNGKTAKKLNPKWLKLK